MKFLWFFGFFFVLSCSDLKPPFYRPINQKHLSGEWRLDVIRISYLGPVKGLWWGEEFFQIELGLENKTDQFRFFKFFDQKTDKYNLLASIKSDEQIKNIFLENRDLFATEDFFKQYPGLQLYFTLEDGSLEPMAIYNGKPVFPKQVSEKTAFYSAAFVASDLGVPQKGAIVQYSLSSSGWLDPKGYRKYTLFFSVPSGAKLQRVKYFGILESGLERE